MKVYVHCNDFTAVYRDCEDATIQQLLQWIVCKYNDRHGDKKLRVEGARAQRGGSGRPLDKSDMLRKVLQDRADVYTICEAIEQPTDCTSSASPAAGFFPTAPCVNITRIERLLSKKTDRGVNNCPVIFTGTNVSSGTGGRAVPEEGILQSPTAVANDPLESAPVVQNLIRTALGAEESKNFRHASTIYEQLLGILPAHTETFKSCLEKMTRLWLTVDRPSDALPWARRAVRSFPNDAGILELLGDCLSHPKAAKAKLPEALTSYTAATEAAIGAGLKDSLARLILAKARVLNRMDDQESKARAASLIMEIVSADQSNWDGLYHYAQVTFGPAVGELCCC